MPLANWSTCKQAPEWPSKTYCALAQMVPCPCRPNLSWEASKGHPHPLAAIRSPAGASAASGWHAGGLGALASCWPCCFVAPPVAPSQSILVPVMRQRAHTTQALPLPERSHSPMAWPMCPHQQPLCKSHQANKIASRTCQLCINSNKLNFPHPEKARLGDLA